MNRQAKRLAFLTALTFAAILLVAIAVVGLTSIAYSDPGSIYGLSAVIFVVPVDRFALLDALQVDGGFTLSLDSTTPAPAYAVAVESVDMFVPGASGTDPAPTERRVVERVMEQARKYVGTDDVDGIHVWSEDDTGTVYVDLVYFYAKRASARYVAKENDEVIDLQRSAAVYV